MHKSILYIRGSINNTPTVLLLSRDILSTISQLGPIIHIKFPCPFLSVRVISEYFPRLVDSIWSHRQSYTEYYSTVLLLRPQSRYYTTSIPPPNCIQSSTLITYSRQKYYFIHTLYVLGCYILNLAVERDIIYIHTSSLPSSLAKLHAISLVNLACEF